MKSALYAAIVYTIAYIDPDMRGKPPYESIIKTLV